MFIQTEETPNENALKFIPGNIPISKDKPYDFPNPQSAENVSDLAKKLFEITGVQRVFFGSNFITLTKSENEDWMTIKPHVFASIVEHMTNGWPIFNNEDENFRSHQEDNLETQKIVAEYDQNDPIIKEIIALIDERVRPAVAMDGGDINFVNFVEGTVYVEMMGACSGCSSSQATLKGGIENMLKHYIPEVKSVEAV